MGNRSKEMHTILATRIKSLREKEGWTQKELADKVYRGESTVRMWELGKSEPDIDTLVTLIKIFNVSADYLLYEEINSMHQKKGYLIPVLGKVAAGIPIEAITDILDYEEIPAEMLKDGSEYFALEIKGDSMEPKISEGDVVIVRKQESCDSGDIAIVSINGDDATCKKVMIHEAGISLVPNNSAHPVMFFTREEIENTPIRIYGKVVELRAKF